MAPSSNPQQDLVSRRASRKLRANASKAKAATQALESPHKQAPMAPLRLPILSTTLATHKDKKHVWVTGQDSILLRIEARKAAAARKNQEFKHEKLYATTWLLLPPVPVDQETKYKNIVTSAKKAEQCTRRTLMTAAAQAQTQKQIQVIPLPKPAARPTRQSRTAQGHYITGLVRDASEALALHAKACIFCAAAALPEHTKEFTGCQAARALNKRIAELKTERKNLPRAPPAAPKQDKKSSELSPAPRTTSGTIARQSPTVRRQRQHQVIAETKPAQSNKREAMPPSGVASFKSLAPGTLRYSDLRALAPPSQAGKDYATYLKEYAQYCSIRASIEKTLAAAQPAPEIRNKPDNSETVGKTRKAEKKARQRKSKAAKKLAELKIEVSTRKMEKTLEKLNKSSAVPVQHEAKESAGQLSTTAPAATPRKRHRRRGKTPQESIPDPPTES